MGCGRVSSLQLLWKWIQTQGFLKFFLSRRHLEKFMTFFGEWLCFFRSFWKLFFLLTTHPNAAAVLEGKMISAAAPVAVTFRIDFFKIHFHGSADCALWLYYSPWSSSMAGVQYVYIHTLYIGVYVSIGIYIQTEFSFVFSCTETKYNHRVSDSKLN